MASADLKALVAREVAQGESIADIARRHDYSHKSMSKLIKTGEVQRLVAQEQEALAEQTRAQLVALSPVAIEGIRSVIEDPNHPRYVDTCRWVVDKVRPRRKDEAPEVSVAVQAQTAQILVEYVEARRAFEKRKEETRGDGRSFEEFLVPAGEGLGAPGAEKSRS